MKIYENESEFYQYDTKLPYGTTPYEINFPNTFNSYSNESFPQFELTLQTRGGYGFTKVMEFTYKKDIKFSVILENPQNYLLRLLNDLKRGDYEQKILEYIKDANSLDEYLTNKAKLVKLNSIEELQYELKTLRDENSHLKQIEIEINILKEDVKSIQMQIDFMKSRGKLIKSILKSFNLGKRY